MWSLVAQALTFLCQGVSCVLAITVVFARLRKVKVDRKPLVFSADIFKKFVMIAVPSILRQSFISIGNIIIQGVINGFGASVMAGYSASVKLNNLVITSFTTLGNGISNYTAQNLGAQKLLRIKEGFRAGIKLVWLLSAPLCLIYFLPDTGYYTYLWMSLPLPQFKPECVFFEFCRRSTLSYRPN